MPSSFGTFWCEFFLQDSFADSHLASQKSLKTKKKQYQTHKVVCLLFKHSSLFLFNIGHFLLNIQPFRHKHQTFSLLKINQFQPISVHFNDFGVHISPNPMPGFTGFQASWPDQLIVIALEVLTATATMVPGWGWLGSKG